MSFNSEIKKEFGDLLTGYEDHWDFLEALEANEIPGYVFQEDHKDLDYEQRWKGPIVQRNSDGKYLWINWEFTSYDAFPEYASVTVVNKVMKEVWE